MKRPGQNVRNLVARRRFRAIAAFVSAATIAAGPVVYIGTIEKSLRASRIATPTIPLYVYGAVGVLALLQALYGVQLWQQANRADQGAKGEEDTGKLLATLQQEGWTIEYGMRLGGGLGDADIVCVSPKGRAFVVDVKSHRGTVFVAGEQLKRRMGRQTYSFEKDFLDQATKQAVQVKQQKRLTFVTPIVAFSGSAI